MLNTGVIQRETGPVEAIFLTEPQLYFVMMRSRSDKARPFRQWVVNEVLPSIRKTGKYEVKKEDPDLALTWDSRLDEIDHQFEELRKNRAMLLRDLSKIYGVPLEATTPDSKGKEEMDIIPVIDVHQNNGVLVTTSRNIAEVFEKEHKHVMRDIRAILEANSDSAFNQSNCGLVDYFDAKGEKRPEYLLTRDGTMLLIMGYTGEKAMAIKTAYIKRFNEMELQLKQQQEVPQLINLNDKLSGTALILRAAGIEGNQLALALDKQYKKEVGYSALNATGTILVAPKQVQLANPTQLGKKLGIGPRKVNQLLLDLDYQIKTASGYEPTQNGLDMGAQLLDVGKKHSDGTPIRQLKWPYSIVEDLQQALEEE